jgi:very-short-patch-repair endonuclease
MSRPERKCYELLRELGIEVIRQYPIGKYSVDFYHEPSRTAIECFGSVHRIPTVAQRDAIRIPAIEALGYRVVILNETEMERWALLLARAFPWSALRPSDTMTFGTSRSESTGTIS